MVYSVEKCVCFCTSLWCKLWCILQAPGAIGGTGRHPQSICSHCFPLTLWQSSQPSRAHWESPMAPKEQPLHTSCVSHCLGLGLSVQALPVFKEWDFWRLLLRHCHLTSKQYSCVGMLRATGKKIFMKDLSWQMVSLFRSLPCNSELEYCKAEAYICTP